LGVVGAGGHGDFFGSKMRGMDGRFGGNNGAMKHGID